MKAHDKVIFDAKVSDRKILLIPVETITGTPYNPSSRTKDGVKLKRLAASVAKYGAIQPLVITQDRDLVDGNRRLAAVKLAGLKYVECIVLPPDLDKDEVFGEVNTTSEKITGRGWLEACRHGYRKAPKEVQAQYQELFGLVGAYGVDMMIEKKVGLNTLTLCKEVRRLGLSIRLDAMIIKVVSAKLANKINMISRSNQDREQKCVQLNELLEQA